ncbi:hypothetical protein NPIL_268361, partial [Nephila pilipes]
LSLPEQNRPEESHYLHPPPACTLNPSANRTVLLEILTHVLVPITLKIWAEKEAVPLRVPCRAFP